MGNFIEETLAVVRSYEDGSRDKIEELNKIKDPAYEIKGKTVRNKGIDYACFAF